MEPDNQTCDQKDKSDTDTLRNDQPDLTKQEIVHEGKLQTLKKKYGNH